MTGRAGTAQSRLPASAPDRSLSPRGRAGLECVSSAHRDSPRPRRLTRGSSRAQAGRPSVELLSLVARRQRPFVRIRSRPALGSRRRLGIERPNGTARPEDQLTNASMVAVFAEWFLDGFGLFFASSGGHNGAQTRFPPPFSILAKNGQNACSTGAICHPAPPQKTRGPRRHRGQPVHVALARGSRSGPIKPPAPAGMKVWQLPQPWSRNTAKPTASSRADAVTVVVARTDIGGGGVLQPASASGVSSTRRSRHPRPCLKLARVGRAARRQS